MDLGQPGVRRISRFQDSGTFPSPTRAAPTPPGACREPDIAGDTGFQANIISTPSCLTSVQALIRIALRPGPFPSGTPTPTPVHRARFVTVTFMQRRAHTSSNVDWPGPRGGRCQPAARRQSLDSRIGSPGNIFERARRRLSRQPRRPGGGIRAPATVILVRKGNVPNIIRHCDDYAWRQLESSPVRSAARSQR